MKKMKSGLHSWLGRFLFILVAAVVLAYPAVVGYVCIREGSVPRTVPENKDYDAIIVLGAQVYKDGTPSVQLSWRLDAGYEAYTQKPVPIVVCGGQGKDEPMPEAEAMAKYLIAKGVPETVILKDPASVNTNQNLANAAELLRPLSQVKKVLIVTSDYHVSRAMALAKDQGYDACGLGSPCKPEYWLKNHAREALAWCKYWGKKYLNLPLE